MQERQASFSGRQVKCKDEILKRPHLSSPPFQDTGGIWVRQIEDLLWQFHRLGQEWGRGYQRTIWRHRRT